MNGNLLNYAYDDVDKIYGSSFSAIFKLMYIYVNDSQSKLKDQND